jgi:hypothetical protein
VGDLGEIFPTPAAVREVAGAWSFIGGRLGFGGPEMDGGGRFQEAWRASAMPAR